MSQIAEKPRLMGVERVYTCDGPECESHARTASPGPPTAFIAVAEDAGRSTQHFCTWDCLLKFAASLPPSEVIPCDEVG